LKSLALLATRPLDWFGPWVRLDLQETKKLLATVRDSGDPAVAAGALFVSIGSASWNVAKVETLGRMLEADGTFSDIGSRLFTSLAPNSLPDRITQLAEAVVRSKFKVSLSTARAAARFLADNSIGKLPPMRTLSTFPCSSSMALK
jgi:hypothetical protein